MRKTLSKFDFARPMRAMGNTLENFDKNPKKYFCEHFLFEVTGQQRWFFVIF
jgi:hypothetical protein